VAGQTIGQWTADWWNWAGSAPVIGDTTGAAATQNQSGPVFFVAGTSGGTAVTRAFDIPANTFVLFPLINWVIANGPDPGFSDTASEATAITDGTIDPAKLFASVDGEVVGDLASHRERAPANFTFTTVQGATGFPAGTFTDANADGYWIMLEPLSAGPHTLHFGGTSNDFVGPDPALTVPSFTVDTTDNVRVGPAAIPLPPGALAALPGTLMAAARLRRRSPRIAG
jgi:hypothetical protein